MRPLHVIHAWPPDAHGGVQGYVRDVLHAQRAAGHAPALLTGSFVPKAVAQVVRADEDGVPVFRLHRDDDFAAWHARAWHPDVARLFTGVLEAVRPDVVHVHHWLFLSTDLVTAAAAARVPAVVTLHDVYTSCPRCYRVDRDGLPCARPLGPEACRTCVPKLGHETAAEIDRGVRNFELQLQHELRLAAKVLTATAATADLLARTAGLPRDRVAVLPFGYRPRLSAPPPAPPPAPPVRFLYLGELSAAKGVSVLLRAFRVVAGRAAGAAVLELFGGTADRAYRREVDELARGLRVTCRGAYEASDLGTVSAHVAVLPMASFETWCFVLDECHELRLPCIVADIGVLRERAGDGALVVPPGDVEALAAAMLRCVAEPLLLECMRRALPALPPAMATHAAALERVYRAAAAPPATRGGVPRAELVEQRLQQCASAARAGSEGAPR